MTLAMVKVFPEPVTPQQSLCGYVLHDAFGQLGDGFRLVAGGLIVGYEFEIHEIRKLVN